MQQYQLQGYRYNNNKKKSTDLLSFDDKFHFF